MEEEIKTSEENIVSTEYKKMSWLIPVIAIVVIIGGLYYANNNKPEPTETTKSTSSASDTIIVEGGMFYFEPNEIRVKKGETVKITFNNKGGLHDFVLEKFNVRTKVIKVGESEVVEFTPNELGEFEFYCSVGNHRQQGMVGKLIVGN